MLWVQPLIAEVRCFNGLSIQQPTGWPAFSRLGGFLLALPWGLIDPKVA